MRRRYVQIEGELVEVALDYVPEPRGPMVMGDIKPYKSVITGEEIGGRRQHREHLKLHGCVEIGNEKLTPKPMREIPRHERREAIRKAIADLRNGKRPMARFGHG